MIYLISLWDFRWFSVFPVGFFGKAAGPTGGYLIGFLFMIPLLTGILFEKTAKLLETVRYGSGNAGMLPVRYRIFACS